MAFFPFVVFAVSEKEEKHNKTQRRKDAKTQRSLFQLYRASASSVPERRQVGAGFGKQACLSLCVPFGFRLRFAHATRFAGPCLPARQPSGLGACPCRWRTGLEDLLLAWAGVNAEESPAVHEVC